MPINGLLRVNQEGNFERQHRCGREGARLHVLFLNLGKLMLNRAFILLLACLIPDVCFAAKPISVPIPVADQLQVEMIESQQEIAVSVSGTAQAVGMQFGLIGAIIGSAVQNEQVKKAEARVAPLRDVLVDYHFNRKMEAALRGKLNSEGISPAPILSVMATGWDAHDAQQAAQLPPSAMVLRPSYSVDSDFSKITVSLNASLVERAIKANGKVKATPSFSRAYSFQFPLQGLRNEQPEKDWLGFGKEGLAILLDQGIAQVTDMLVQDFSAEGRSMWDAKPKKESVVVAGTVYPGLPVRQGADWAWVRIGKGGMQTVQGYQPLQVGTLPASLTTGDVVDQSVVGGEVAAANPAASSVADSAAAAPVEDASETVKAKEAGEAPVVAADGG